MSGILVIISSTLWNYFDPLVQVESSCHLKKRIYCRLFSITRINNIFFLLGGKRRRK